MSGADEHESRPTIIVPTRRFDALGIDVNVQTLACLDVQGYEWNVLAGAQTLCGPMTLEFWPHGLARAGKLEEFIDRVAVAGDVFDLTHDGRAATRADLLDIAADRDLHICDLLVLPHR